MQIQFFLRSASPFKPLHLLAEPTVELQLCAMCLSSVRPSIQTATTAYRRPSGKPCPEEDKSLTKVIAIWIIDFGILSSKSAFDPSIMVPFDTIMKREIEGGIHFIVSLSSSHLVLTPLHGVSLRSVYSSDFSALASVLQTDNFFFTTKFDNRPKKGIALLLKIFFVAHDHNKVSASRG
uniref:Uncharacterized protein n=1 Tax=Steinernema glaseri TaxID=37863 RepID=A0A1I8AA63_9BILA